jgi:hypothetical protein
MAAARAVLLCLLAGCSLSRGGLEPGDGGGSTGEDAARGRDGGRGDDAAVEPDAGADAATPDAGGRDAGEPPPDAALPVDGGSPIGCIPAGWVELFRDDFDSDLSAWDIDENKASGGSSWRTGGGELIADCPGSGSDAVANRAASGDEAIAAAIAVEPTDGVTGIRAGGLIARATAIDFADNLFYFCGFDPSSGDVVLARYDVETRVGPGTSFTQLDAASVAAPIDGPVLVTLCAIGDQLTCELPELGVALSARDGRYPTGTLGLRTLRSEIRADAISIYGPP